jgi:hypothetical protein
VVKVSSGSGVKPKQAAEPGAGRLHRISSL